MAEADWALWRSFAAVMEHGTLTGAARALGASQPTIGRHVEALEQTLGIALFERSLQGLRPNETAIRLYEPVKHARDSLAEASLVAEGANPELSGSVRITSSTVMCHYVLPSVLADLRLRFPQVAIELVPSDSVENLLLREADIAVRMFRPTQLDLIARKLGETPMTTTAHRSYLERRGTPQALAELFEHDLIGLDKSDMITAGARQLGFSLNRNQFVLRTDSQTNIWELAKAGLGITFAQTMLVKRTDGMVAILPELQLPPLEVWLCTHRELFVSRRIRAIYDRLAHGIADYLQGRI